MERLVGSLVKVKLKVLIILISVDLHRNIIKKLQALFIDSFFKLCWC
jgi:hypothetical protein